MRRPWNYRRAGNANEAIALLKEASLTNPADIEVSENLGDALHQAGLFKEAETPQQICWCSRMHLNGHQHGLNLA
jgi:tetratricopeptide (TPR) repeat protein